MKAILKRYTGVILTAVAFVVFVAVLPQWRDKALGGIVFQASTMLLVIPPIFVLLGLMDVWVPRDQMIKYMGPGSGCKGPVLAFLLGSFAAGPLYGAFPLAAVLMKKGASLMNILIFIGAWSTTKIPMLMFEISSLGPRFALSRLAIDIVGIIIIALAIKAWIPAREVERLYAEAEKL
ncbi:MAG: permease [Spirochaetes bacterium RIFOXYC1_FULL_54_7]|nr:MAG: permease [Spirochaetes bacterium RIFOXYC1_FULL_54_7]